MSPKIVGIKFADIDNHTRFRGDKIRHVLIKSDLCRLKKLEKHLYTFLNCEIIYQEETIKLHITLWTLKYENSILIRTELLFFFFRKRVADEKIFSCSSD